MEGKKLFNHHLTEVAEQANMTAETNNYVYREIDQLPQIKMPYSCLPIYLAACDKQIHTQTYHIHLPRLPSPLSSIPPPVSWTIPCFFLLDAADIDMHQRSLLFILSYQRRERASIY